MKSILPLITLLLIIGSCKKDKDNKDPYAGEFAFKSTLVISSKPQYMNLNGSLADFSDKKYIWKIEKAVDDKYYISSADYPGKVLADKVGIAALLPKSTTIDETQLFRFIPSADNNNTFYLRLASNPNKYISLQTVFGGAYLLSKDIACPPIGCFYQKFSLEP
jgi:hypothetical protein